MNKMKRNLIVFLTILLLLFSLVFCSSCEFGHPYPAYMDAGFFGGGGDYGGGGGGDGGGGSNGGGGFDVDWSGDGKVTIFEFILTIILVPLLPIAFWAIAYSIELIIRRLAKGKTFVERKARKLDLDLVEADMVQKIKDLYILMQKSWEEQNWEVMRPHLTDNLYNQLYRQMQELVMRNQVNKVEDIEFAVVRLTDLSKDSINNILKANIIVSILDYTIDRQTGEVVSGNVNNKIELCYNWTLIKTGGAQNQEGEKELRLCPSCGAHINLEQSGKCFYCNSIVTSTSFDWVLSNIEGVYQRTLRN